MASILPTCGASGKPGAIQNCPQCGRSKPTSNGQVVLEEPTDMPKRHRAVRGARRATQGADVGDDLDDEERNALHRELDASMAEAEAGELVDFDAVPAQLR